MLGPAIYREKNRYTATSQIRRGLRPHLIRYMVGNL
jgi:hypothetical protein